jgi:hypothetical protein
MGASELAFGNTEWFAIKPKLRFLLSHFCFLLSFSSPLLFGINPKLAPYEHFGGHNRTITITPITCQSNIITVSSYTAMT